MGACTLYTRSTPPPWSGRSCCTLPTMQPPCPATQRKPDITLIVIIPYNCCSNVVVMPDESSLLCLFQCTPLTTSCFPSASRLAATSRPCHPRPWSDRRKNGPHQRQTRRAGGVQRSPPGDFFLCIPVFVPPFLLRTNSNCWLRGSRQKMLRNKCYSSYCLLNSFFHHILPH